MDKQQKIKVGDLVQGNSYWPYRLSPPLKGVEKDYFSKYRYIGIVNRLEKEERTGKEVVIFSGFSPMYKDRRECRAFADECELLWSCPDEFIIESEKLKKLREEYEGLEIQF